MAPQAVRAPGETDVWLFYEADQGRKVRADLPRSFLYLLCSPSTEQVELIGKDGGPVKDSDDRVRVRLKGPVCSDGNRLWSEITLTRDLLSDEALGLTEEEQRRLYATVAGFLSRRGVYMANVLQRFRLALKLPGRVR